MHGGRSHALLQGMQGDCQLLKGFALCEFLLKMLYANPFLLSGREKVGHMSWVCCKPISGPFAYQGIVWVHSPSRSSSALGLQPAQTIRTVLVPKKLQLYTLKGVLHCKSALVCKCSDKTPEGCSCFQACLHSLLRNVLCLIMDLTANKDQSAAPQILLRSYERILGECFLVLQ